MEIVPIISTLRRHKTAASLIVIEIALTCAIVCNALFLIHDRMVRMDRPSGVAESELLDVRLTGIGTKTDANALTAQDIAALRAIPGVTRVSSANMVPFGNSSSNTDVSRQPDDPHGTSAATYAGRDLIATMGVQVFAGRAFNANEYVDYKAALAGTTRVDAVIITHALADHLFPDGDAVGKPLYVMGEYPSTIVGVIDDLIRPNEFGERGTGFYSLVLPVDAPYTEGGHYVIATAPEQREAVLAAVAPTLDRVDPARIILKQRTFEELRRDYYRADRAMAYLLAGVSLGLLLITALGVVGLASFWVQQRTRQIGVRRALGATRGHIIRYFLVENFILATAGIAFGMALAYAINLWLMDRYQVPRLPAGVLPLGAALLWALGQVAVLGPATRASLIAPAIATRTV